MDWLRAKLILIAAFVCVDAFLVWQVSRLTVPLLYLQMTGAGVSRPTRVSARVGVYLMGEAEGPAPVPQSAPRLRVATVGVERRALALLGPRYSCEHVLGPLGPLYASDCRSPGGAELRQLGGALVFTSPVRVAGAESASAARRAADGIVRLVDPVGAGNPVVGPWDPTTRGRAVSYLEVYDGVPLFVGTWTVSVGATGITATRFWVRVLGTLPPDQPLISPDQALTEAAAAYGAGPARPLTVEGPVLFGYYYPLRQPPAAPSAGGGAPVRRVWELVPVWRIRTAEGRCLYVNAYNGQPEQAGPALPLQPVAC